MLLSACTLPGTGLQQDAIPDSTEGQDLTIAAAADDVFSLNCNTKYSFNPLIATNHSNQLVCSLVYENMVEVDNSFNVIPNVVTEWEINDNSGASWTLTIDTTRTFHDGSPITPNDLRYSLERAVNCDRFSGRFRSYMGSVPSGNDKLVVTLGIGDTSFINLLNIPVIKYGSYDEKFPDGTGPYYYEFEETKQTTGTGENAKTETVLKPVALHAYEGHKDYGKLPLDTIYIKEYSQPEAIIDAFEDSYIDAVINDPSSYTNLGYASINEIHTYATTNMHFVGFNQESTVGSMSGVRYAMQYAFDRSYLVELLDNNAVASPIPMYPTCEYYPTSLADSLALDLVKCRTILENNGIKDYDEDGKLELVNGLNDDFTISFILCSDSSAKAGMANRFAQDMASIGVTVNIQELTWTDYYNALTDYENLTKEQKEDEDFKEIEWDMFYGEVKIRQNWDISELLTPRTDKTKYSSINYTHSTDTGHETLIYNFLGAGDSSRANNYKAFAEYITLSSCQYVFIGFEKQQLITHRQAIRGLDPNLGNPLYDFANWKIMFGNEDEEDEDD